MEIYDEAGDFGEEGEEGDPLEEGDEEVRSLGAGCCCRSYLVAVVERTHKPLNLALTHTYITDDRTAPPSSCRRRTRTLRTAPSRPRRSRR